MEPDFREGLKNGGLVLVLVSASYLLGWWGEQRTRSMAVVYALTGVIVGSLPLVVAVRRWLWAYRAADPRGWREGVYTLFAVSMIAFPVALLCFYAVPPWPGEGFTRAGWLALGWFISVGTAGLAFLAQVILDRWWPIATAVVTAYQTILWLFVAWMFS